MEQTTVTVGGEVDKYEVDSILATYSRNLEDLFYKISVLEDGMAELTAYISELKEGDRNAKSKTVCE